MMVISYMTSYSKTSSVCMLRECEGARVTEMLAWGWCGFSECRACGGTRGSGTVSSAYDVLGISEVRGIRGVS